MDKLVFAAAVFCGLIGSGSLLCAEEADSDEAMPTLWIIGDSTVRNNTPGQQGWGDPIAEHFNAGRIRVVNRAIGGRSSRTFITDGRWDKILGEARPGDYVLMQFGHNDAGALDDTHRARGTIRGIGDEYEEIYNPIRKLDETVYTYGWYMRVYCNDAKSRGLTPIVLSYIPRCPRLDDDLPISTELRSYALHARQVAEQTGSLFIDLFGRIAERYNDMTAAEIKANHFCEADYTHTSPAGAAFNAARVVDGIRALDGCDLKDYLVDAPAAD